MQGPVSAVRWLPVVLSRLDRQIVDRGNYSKVSAAT
jgi:hypothetical protein